MYLNESQSKKGGTCPLHRVKDLTQLYLKDLRKEVNRGEDWWGEINGQYDYFFPHNSVAAYSNPYRLRVSGSGFPVSLSQPIPS